MSSDVSFEVICHNYFANLNTLSQKIAADINATKNAYQHLWDTLTETEKKQVIDESIINPAVAIKYANYYEKVLKQDDYIYSYSWFTKSQMDLYNQLNTSSADKHSKGKAVTLKSLKYCNDKISRKMVTPSSVLWDSGNNANVSSSLMNVSSDIFNKIKNKFVGYKINTNLDETQSLITECSKTVVPYAPTKSVAIVKPKNPPPPPPPIACQLITPEECEKLITSDVKNSEIPKTGFDFLDNW